MLFAVIYSMETITTELRDKLSITVCPDDISEYFKGIADLLMNKFVISKGKDKYEIIEVEFYFFAPNHPDVITYPRNCKAGQWFFHQSGVDLTFETTNNQFGGILIRGLRKIGGDCEQIFGPLKCVEKLWDVFDAFDRVPSEYPVIEAHAFSESDYKKPLAFPRWIPLSAKKVKEAGNEEEAKNSRVRSLCRDYQKHLTKHSELGIDKDLYNEIEEGVAVKIVFESKYRFFKMGAIEEDDNAWLGYAAKPKST